MEHLKKANIYKNSPGTCTFNPDTKKAYSYSWWLFVSPINGKLVFNNYNYSPTTCKHQWKLRSLLSTLGLTIDLTIEAPKGLQDLESAIKHYETKIAILQAAIAKKGSRKSTNAERASLINEHQITIAQIKSLQGA